MDPNATLEHIREIVDTINSGELDHVEMSEAATDLASMFEDLDTWLSDGGFKPAEWSGNDY